MKIKTKLLVGYLFMAVLALVLSVTNIYGLSNTQTQYNSIINTADPTIVALREMGKVMEEIAVAANEGAEGTTTIAQKSAMVLEKSDEVMNQADVSKKSSDNLNNMISKFTV